MSIKSQSIGALFVALVVILAISPKVVNNIYGTILGRLFLVSIVIFFAMNNTTLGLLVALAIITASNQLGSFVEGMENGASITVGDDNSGDSSSGDTKRVLTADAVKARISELKEDAANGTNPVDSINTDRKLTKDSKEIPVDSSMNSSSTGEVSASAPGTLTTSKLEGFTSLGYAPF